MANRIDSVWKKVERLGPHDCWPWKGYQSWGKRGGGYGRIDLLGRKGVYAHRVAYLASHPGSISLDRRDGILVLHRCDNVVCCNPDHLYLGDHDKNMRDKVERGRAKWASSVASPNAKFTEEDVRQIRYFKKYGATKRAIALLYDVSTSCIGHCLYGLTYQDID